MTFAQHKMVSANVQLLLTDMVGMNATKLSLILISLCLDQIHNYAELKRLLADIDAPLRRMDDNLKNIQDDLQGEWLTKKQSTRSCLQHPSAKIFYYGCHPNHICNTTSRQRRVCFQELGNGFSQTPSLRNGRRRVRPPSYGFTEFLGRVRASWCKSFVHLH